SYNSALGDFAMYYNSSGNYNTAVGSNALLSTTTSWYNTAIGYNAGDSYDMGYNNTILGANCDINASGLFNCIAIGQAVTSTASSQARIGNAATSSIGGYANWTNISDGRFKKDIKEDVKGIEFIMNLRPVTYHLDVAGLSTALDEGRGKELDKYSKQAISEKEKLIYSGFVAQEVEKAAKLSGYDFSGVDKPKNEKDLYGLRYAEFVVPLVKAVQEQQQMIDELKKQNAELRTVLGELKKVIGK
ncbi:MAG TPA: tail fiber domain-containing protein, partial [Ferruginibacter sp.]|nr:tail fiber domain-containing protein [Ferruginibacter sp.]